MDGLIMDASSSTFQDGVTMSHSQLPKSMMGKEVVAYPDQAINQTNKNDGQQHSYPCNQLLIL
jgi:hypothetical protein